MQVRVRWRHRIAVVAVLPLWIGASSCVGAIAVGSDASGSADRKIAELSQSIADRFTSPERSGRFEVTRRRLVQGALDPDRVYNDTSIWTTSYAPATRALVAHGTLTDRGYRFDVLADHANMSRAGDARHTITLRKLSDGEFRWNANVDFAVGSITADDAATMLVGLLAGAHDREAASLRADAHAAFPRSSAVLGRVFTIDAMTTHPSAQGTTTVEATIGIRADGIRATLPHFADYIRRYVTSSRYRFTLSDHSGAMYFDAVGHDQLLTIRYRVKAGALVTYLGPPRPLGDSLRLVSDLSMHVKMFDVGWSGLALNFSIKQSDHSQSWLMVAKTEPDWHLPLITERLIRAPLHRPFQGDGSSFEIGVSDSVGGQSLLFRRARLDMKESAMMRFLGGLVSRVFDDLDANVEREEAIYIRELLIAFQQDAHAILGK